MKFTGHRQYCAVVAILVFATWIISLGIHSKSGVATWDQSVWQFSVEHGSGHIHAVARRISSLGVLGVLLPGAACVGIVIWVQSRSFVMSLAPWVSVTICGEVVAYLKRVTDIARPPVGSQVLPVLNPSFPSGHAANTTALVVSVLIIVWSLPHGTTQSKRLATACGVVVAMGMGATRVVLNVHWISDVLAGWCVGAAVAFAVTGTARAVTTRVR